MARIFIVEDNQKISEVLDDYFKHINFHVSTFKSGNAVITEVKKDPPDVILLDLMLPGKDGLTVCREIRSFSKVP
ncbi:MAG: response regulator, partial [Deltaproteobacteria bacterium]|nr:response regulator [Deltaproteobacteria bacterium]